MESEENSRLSSQDEKNNTNNDNNKNKNLSTKKQESLKLYFYNLYYI